MLRFLAARLTHGIVVIFAATVVVFVVIRMVGDPVRVMLPLDATQEQRDQLTEKLGLNDPIFVQFFDYFGGLLRGDFGESIWQRESALPIVLGHIPRTFELVGAGVLLAVVIAIPIALLAAAKPGSWIDRITTTLGILGMSLPQFWLGLLLILLFSVVIGILPPSGSGSLAHLILPAVTLALPLIGRFAMTLRSSLIDEYSTEYARVLVAKGMPFKTSVSVHVLRNASTPFITMVGWETIRAVAGYAVVVETVFAWPGIGFLALQSVERQDLILLQTVVLVVAVLVVVMNVALDLLYRAIDPRVEIS